MEFNEGERRSAPPARRDLDEVHGSRSVAGGRDVGTERPEHEQGSRSRYPGHIPRGIRMVILSLKAAAFSLAKMAKSLPTTTSSGTAALLSLNSLTVLSLLSMGYS